MFLNFHLKQYFPKDIRKEIGELYASSAISNFALSLVMLFEPIFLYVVLHFSVTKILGFFAVVYAVYILAIPLGGKVASIYGYRHCIALSVPFQIFYWLALLASTSHPNAAFVAAAVFGIQKTFYWPGFHSVMARYTQSEQMGRAFGASYAIVSLANIAGPMVGGLISQRFGLAGGFFAAAIVYCFSIFPLLMAKEIFVPKVYHFRDTLELYRTDPRKFLGYMGFGEELLFLTVWPIFIYTVVKNYGDVGVLVTAASLVAAALALVVGKITDQYTKRILVRIGAFFTALIWLARFVATTSLNTFSIDALARTAKETYFIPLSTLTYLRAEATHIVPYAVFFEQSLAVGKLLACLLGMLLFSLTGSFMLLFILAALFSLLYMYI